MLRKLKGSKLPLNDTASTEQGKHKTLSNIAKGVVQEARKTNS
jgi:hypothetical protein